MMRKCCMSILNFNKCDMQCNIYVLFHKHKEHYNLYCFMTLDIPSCFLKVTKQINVSRFHFEKFACECLLLSLNPYFWERNILYMKLKISKCVLYTDIFAFCFLSKTYFFRKKNLPPNVFNFRKKINNI